jgi:signal peptidase I
MSLPCDNNVAAKPSIMAAREISHSGRSSRKLLPNVKQAALAFGIALALLLVNDTFVFESVVVPTSSMAPTILPNERIVLAHFPLGRVRRFDVVVINERAARKRIVKRVVGLPGDRVRLEEGWKVFINGKALAYRSQGLTGQWTEEGDHAIELALNVRPPETLFGKSDLQLGSDEYFVLGDNRLASSDGRVFGPVKRKDIQGVVSLIWYSFDLKNHRLRTGRVPHWMR